LVLTRVAPSYIGFYVCASVSRTWKSGAYIQDDVCATRGLPDYSSQGSIVLNYIALGQDSPTAPLRIVPGRTDAPRVGGVACFLRGSWIRILVLFVPVVLTKRSGKLTYR